MVSGWGGDAAAEGFGERVDQSWNGEKTLDLGCRDNPHGLAIRP
jgi:hypothetical protein